ncbi:glycoside hydrolase family 113 [Bacillus sp. FSL K6-3431]|uniref:glycoside hydrolase family 113 n=1 Tax=Bacillus sp. FSL K6-3431 TaxID=2921500 RepID=UPI0030F79B7E
MDYIKGFTYGWICKKGDFYKEEARKSLRLMKERTNSDHVIIAFAALQDTPHSTEIDYTGAHMPEDEEFVSLIEYARSLDLKVIMKPTVNVRNGTWRAHINFFDLDVPCEPKWYEWFKSYTDYQLHYAKIAEETKCEMMIVGCEMVQTERRDYEWRQLCKAVKEVYTGPITYNTDKYQEGNVKWWDAVDIISSSGYYPIYEAGCPSRTDSSFIPNDWGHEGSVNMEEQNEFYKMMFEKTKERTWVKGFGLWDWSAFLYDENDAPQNDGYDVFGKPAEKTIKAFYSEM